MSDLLSTYEADFQYTAQDVQKKFEEVSSLQGDARHSALKDLESSIDELKEIIGSMETEILGLPSSNRASFNSKIRTFRSQLQSHESLLKKYEDDEDRRELFGGRTDNGSGQNYSDFDQRQGLLQTNASLARTSDRLKDSQRIANETEDIGANILNNLRGQREQLVNSRNTLMEADGYVDKSIRTLRTMSRRMAANKMLSYAIIAVLIILIFLVLISKFR
ncbi:v-SNARE protein [Saccharomycopsis crataegensis]|uniref:V-SNARE protein n=1 Tax=Saccharomycopsis crataegensis TaxID=43959 RepID=A0AAV5QHT2_9ASCO|nr:v-SNARE protein [Saccharomycopsis crataegensis]